MDLSTVQNKVSNRTYKTRQEFLDDFELIVNNCLQYNGDDTCKFIHFNLMHSNLATK